MFSSYWKSINIFKCITTKWILIFYYFIFYFVGFLRYNNKNYISRFKIQREIFWHGENNIHVKMKWHKCKTFSTALLSCSSFIPFCQYCSYVYLFFFSATFRNFLLSKWERSLKYSGSSFRCILFAFTIPCQEHGLLTSHECREKCNSSSESQRSFNKPYFLWTLLSAFVKVERCFCKWTEKYMLVYALLYSWISREELFERLKFVPFSCVKINNERLKKNIFSIGKS